MNPLWKAGMPAAAVAVLAVGVMAAGSARIDRGQLAPDFAGTTLDGKKVTLSQFRGKNPVLLNFYADFCGPCRAEFPHLKALDEKLGGKGLRVVAVSLDAERDTAANLPRKHNVRFPVVFDPKNAVAERYQVQAIPHTVIIDRDGKVQTVITGADLEKLDRCVEQVLK